MMRAISRSVLAFVLRMPALRLLALICVYGAVLGLGIFVAYQLRFDFSVPDNIAQNMLSVCAITVAVQLVCLFLFHQFDGLLTYFSTPDLRRLLSACCLATLIITTLRFTIGVIVAPPRGVILINFILSIASIGALRLSFRALRHFVYHPAGPTIGKVRRIGIVGAGDCGAVLVKELLRSPWLGMRPVAFFDDNYRRRCGIHGLPLVGRPERIEELKDKLRLDELVIAMPSASPRRIQEILQLVNRAGLSCRTVPSLDQLAAGHVTVTNLRPLDIHDLLGRPPVEISHESVSAIIEGRTVIVTGAGGSIGSELCRQILPHGPAALIMLERSEPQLFLIEQELRTHSLNGASLVPVIADITRSGRLQQIFHRFRPHVVFHAAAHKHVPLMELQPEEAIYNNIYATSLLADTAVKYAVERFVFISSDKAVNPTNVMGATKRLGEIYMQAVARQHSGTKFMAVRFGNVLGSSGSVVPTFARQIASGGPITVTHPEITRYFMTIPEAVSLVLQSSVFGKSGDIFVLDMGTPVRIAELARKMTALAGLTPDDVEIVFTGLRPGEKLYEELSQDVEAVVATPHPKIARLVAPKRRVNGADFVDRLRSACEASNTNPQGLKLLLARFLPEYTPADSHPAPTRMTAIAEQQELAYMAATLKPDSDGAERLASSTIQRERNGLPTFHQAHDAFKGHNEKQLPAVKVSAVS
jgi:FlaA1/EpsC-like NDP-sugar epimerase